MRADLDEAAEELEQLLGSFDDAGNDETRVYLLVAIDAMLHVLTALLDAHPVSDLQRLRLAALLDRVEAVEVAFGAYGLLN